MGKTFQLYGSGGIPIVGIILGTTLVGTTFGISFVGRSVGISVEMIAGEVGNEVLVLSGCRVKAEFTVDVIGVGVEMSCSGSSVELITGRIFFNVSESNSDLSLMTTS
jgi:hypothetical protein